MLTYGRSIISDWALAAVNQLENEVHILDIGSGRGDDLCAIQNKSPKKMTMHGIEYYPEYIALCEEKGITVHSTDIEKSRLPFEDGALDLVIANQIIEHVKDHFWMVSEISRVLKPGGVLILGIPNLGAWHDRAILLLGQQPSSIKVLGPHVRGFTRPGLQQFIECEGYFKLNEYKASGFYPFPERMAKSLARLVPNMATSLFFNFTRTSKPGLFIDVLKTRFYETNYYNGARK